ncbi:hypothetical protein AC629_13200 [Bradyrhizobium sp. NAS80.1]|uniref:hypothetical protein n=1 Tax=Bradyrhizobium sp. NAS80.1 TaxID=1680159 RepID=UPI0009692CDF|nr:hypothetical protein [Bradyrhizobium sp. NAS80.1]OKO87622.1 hypothetical protein AC629_13200 [Bradyrhizobium sp. NAS80.1]
MLANPHQSCVILLNVTRGGKVDAQASASDHDGAVALLPACRELFGVRQIAVGEYQHDLLPNQVAACIEHLDVDALSSWRDPRLAARLTELNTGIIFLGGAFLEEEVLIAALAGAAHGYEIRLLSDLSFGRREADRPLALTRLAHYGILATTIRQALLEWSVSLGDPALSRRVQDLLS